MPDPRCIDCGDPMTPTLDGPLCPPCAHIAMLIYGTIDARIRALSARS